MNFTNYDEYVPFYSAKDLQERERNPVLKNKPLQPISQKKCKQSVKPSRYYHNLLNFALKPFNNA